MDFAIAVRRGISQSINGYTQLLKKYPSYILYGMLHYFFSGLGQTFLISIFVPFFIADLGIDNLRFTSLYSLATLLSSFLLPYLGSILDRVKIRYFSIAVGGGIIIFALLASQVHHWLMLVFVLFGLRLCGQGLLPLTSTTGIARYFDKNRGKALAVSGFGMSISEAVLSFLLAVLIGSTFGIHWRNIWIGLAASVLVIFLPAVIALVKIDSPFQTGKLGESLAKGSNTQNLSRKEVMRNKNFYLIVLVYLFFPVFFTGMVINHNLLAAHKGWTMSLMATALAAYGITGLVSKVIGGAIVDKYSATKVFPYILLPFIPAVLCLMFFSHPSIAFVYMILGGVSASLISLTVSALWAELYGTEHFGAIRSMTSTFMVFASAFAPILFSYGMATPDRLFITLSLCLAVVVGLTLLAFYVIKEEEHRKKSIHEGTH